MNWTGLRTASTAGTGTGLIAALLIVLGVALAANQAAGWDPGTWAMYALASPAGFLTYRRTQLWVLAGLSGGLTGAAIVLAAIACLTLALHESWIKFTVPVAESLLFGSGWMGAAGGVLVGSLMALIGALATRFDRSTGYVLATLARARQTRRFKHSEILWLGLLAAALIIGPQLIGLYWNQVLGSIGIYLLMGLGLNIVVGYAGLLDLGYVAFFAIGAYAMAILTSSAQGFGLDFWAALPIAAAIGAVAGVLLAIPVLSLRGDYLAIVTLGFGEVIRIFSQNLVQITNGPQGVLDVARPTVGELTFVDSKDYFYLIAVATVLVAAISLRLAKSPIGRAWFALREDEDVARALGIKAVRYKLLAFAIGAIFAGIGGAIFASRQSAIFPADFTLLVSINVLCLVIIGGMGSVPGVIVGSVVLVGLPEVLREVSEFRLAAFGLLLILAMILRPRGLIPKRSDPAPARPPALKASEFG